MAIRISGESCVIRTLGLYSHDFDGLALCGHGQRCLLVAGKPPALACNPPCSPVALSSKPARSQTSEKSGLYPSSHSRAALRSRPCSARRFGSATVICAHASKTASAALFSFAKLISTLPGAPSTDGTTSCANVDPQTPRACPSYFPARQKVHECGEMVVVNSLSRTQWRREAHGKRGPIRRPTKWARERARSGPRPVSRLARQRAAELQRYHRSRCAA